jgi:hypothetical protein
MPLATQHQQARLRPAASSPLVAGTQVGPAEFRVLLLSRRRMVRFDRRESGLYGLRDVDSGELFYIEERQLVDG